MFGKHFAFGFEGAGEQGWHGWTPPWLQEEHHEHHGHHHGHRGHHRHEGRGPWQGWGGPRFGQGFGPEFGPEQFGPGRPGFGPGQFGPGFGPRFFGMRRGRGPFGPGGPGFGPGGDGPRFFGRGDVKFALLALLQERPMHGYEMIKALEEKSGGFYSPSPGSVYPTLQLLEDRGLVTVNEVEGKKVYSITDAGRALLAERQEQGQRQNGPEFGPPWMRRRGGNRPGPEIQALRSEAMEVARLMTIAGRMSFQNPEQLAKLREIVERTRKDLSDMIYSGQGQTNEGSAAQQPDSPTVENV